jgi:hypothetical protein
MLRLSVIFMLVGLTSALGASPYLSRFYAASCPVVAEPASGRVYVHHVRGGMDVYVTRGEYWLAFGSFAGGLLLSAAGGFLFVRSMRKVGVGAA